jgi:hypothetical protein
VTIVPLTWAAPSGPEHAVLLLLRRVSEDSDKDFSLTVINTREGEGAGLDYHPCDLDCADGSMLRNLSFEIKNISNLKATNSTFWYGSYTYTSTQTYIHV